MKPKAFVLASAITVAAMTASAAKDAIEVDRTGRGAVLCTHWLYASWHEIARLCFADEAPEVVKALEKAVADHEVFIARNSDLTRDQARDLTRERVDGMSKTPTDERVCSSLADRRSSFLTHYFPRDTWPDAPRKIEASTTAILEVDRKPLLEPCL